MQHNAVCAHRRRALGLAAAMALGQGLPHRAAVAASPPTGWVLPRLAPPALRLVAAGGKPASLAAAVAGRVTAVQLMFTGCSTSCPPQGALFAALAQRLTRNDFQLLSISIDALSDTPAKVAAWQARFGQFAAWQTAVADLKDVDRLGDFMKGTAGKAGTHTSQVFVFDRQGRLCYRSGDAPSVAELDALVRELARVA